MKHILKNNFKASISNLKHINFLNAHKLDEMLLKHKDGSSFCAATAWTDMGAILTTVESTADDTDYSPDEVETALHL